MKAHKTSPTDIDQYIASFPKDVQQILQQIRQTIREAAPEASETIKYQMPTFTQNGNLIHFAAFTKHIGMYPAPRGHEEFKDELAAYDGEKGTLRFPLDKPMPLDLIRRIIEFRVKHMSEKAEAKGKEH